MKLPTNLSERLTKNLYTMLAAISIAVLLFGFLIFFTTSITPTLRARNDAASELADARQALAKAQVQQSTTPTDLQQQVLTARAALTQALGVFLPDYQASLIVDGLYRKAADTGVAIVDFQTEVAVTPGLKPLYTTTAARLRVQGLTFDLVRYLASLGETTVKGVALNTVTITRSEMFANLLLDMTLFTSPYAPEQPIPVNTQVAVPLPPSTPVLDLTPEPLVTIFPEPAIPDPSAPLFVLLDRAWAAQDWGAAIPVIQQILTINPTYPDMLTKLYAAHVNFGYQLQNRGDIEGAKREFSLALQANRTGGEATAALQQLLQASTPAARGAYVVQLGDTLASIAQQFGITQQQLIQANNLTNLTITPGQQLLIP